MLYPFRSSNGRTLSDKIILAFRSGGVCAFPQCGRELTYKAKQGDDTI